MEKRKPTVDVKNPNKGYYATVLCMGILLSVASISTMKLRDNLAGQGFTSCSIYDSQTLKCTIAAR